MDREFHAARLYTKTASPKWRSATTSCSFWTGWRAFRSPRPVRLRGRRRPHGKQQTRAYSIASAANGNRFELCVNRVEEGFFSNHLADLPDFPSAPRPDNGPHGHFILQEPITDSILIATGTGVAPMRGFLQWLFPADGTDRSGGKEIWLVYGTRHETDIYYHEEFEALASTQAELPLSAHAEPRPG